MTTSQQTWTTLQQDILSINERTDKPIILGKAYLLWSAQYAEFKRLKQIYKLQQEVWEAKTSWPRFDTSKDAIAFLDE
jgi:hypothetical protein